MVAYTGAVIFLPDQKKINLSYKIQAKAPFDLDSLVAGQPKGFEEIYFDWLRLHVTGVVDKMLKEICWHKPKIEQENEENGNRAKISE